MSSAVAAIPGPEPSTARKVANFVAFQVTWAVAVGSAAHGAPWTAVVCVALAVVAHVASAHDPWRESMLIGAVSLIGLGFEALRLQLADVAYTSGQAFAFLPPLWLVAMWSLFACTLNLSLRWLRGRLAIAAALGAIGGPLAFVAGVKLGAARFVDARSALLSIGGGWLVLTPLLLRLAIHFDGVAIGRNEP
jgi:hypothetical protein